MLVKVPGTMGGDEWINPDAVVYVYEKGSFSRVVLSTTREIASSVSANGVAAAINAPYIPPAQVDDIDAEDGERGFIKIRQLPIGWPAWTVPWAFGRGRKGFVVNRDFFCRPKGAGTLTVQIMRLDENTVKLLTPHFLQGECYMVQDASEPGRESDPKWMRVVT